MDTVNVKEEARQIIEQLPDNSTWEDLMHKIYVRQSIEAGLAHVEAGKTTSVEDLREQFGLSR